MQNESPLVPIAERLRDDVSRLRFGPPVRHVYNPLDYGWASHREYLSRFGRGKNKVLIVGMNPGYFGMVQTGVPFGDVDMIRDWLGIHESVRRPRVEHSKRPIAGFECHRHEVSGQRFWGWARVRFGAPERFFARFFVHNYCPLCFLQESGANLPADKLPRSRSRERLFAACDRALQAVVEALAVRNAIALGRFAEEHVERALGATLASTCVPHPSPANPQANRGWARMMDGAVAALERQRSCRSRIDVG